MKKTMSIRELFLLLKTDIDRYKATGAKNGLRIVLFYQGFWASGFYRVFQYLYIKTQKSRILRIPIALFYHIGVKVIQISTGISLPVGANIGKGIYLAHFGPILVSSKSEIGDNCNLGNQVIIGYGIVKGNPGHPKLGNRVFVGPGAKIFGPVKIGNDVAIGSNAVVTQDVPDRAFVAGVPAKIIDFHGSYDYIYYFGVNDDIERQNNFKLSRGT